jgi:hypothetical protein
MIFKCFKSPNYINFYMVDCLAWMEVYKKVYHLICLKIDVTLYFHGSQPCMKTENNIHSFKTFCIITSTKGEGLMLKCLSWCFEINSYRPFHFKKKIHITIKILMFLLHVLSSLFNIILWKLWTWQTIYESDSNWNKVRC